MNNVQFKCPTETTPGISPWSCVMDCSTAGPAKFELRTLEGAQKCVSTDDPSVKVHLIAQSMVARPIDDSQSFSIADLNTKDHDAFARYSAELTRYTNEMTTAQGAVGREAQIETAKTALLNAAPGEATDAAKNAYMLLTGDPDIASYTISQSARSSAQKVTDQYISDYQFLASQSNQQQNTIDLINSVKDNIFTVKDDVEFSVNTFGKQVRDIQNQINMNNRKREQALDYGKWLSIVLNVAIILALIFAIFVLGRKAVMAMPSRTTDTSNTYDYLTR